MTSEFRTRLIDALARVGFEENELAYLALTGKLERQIIDRIAWPYMAKNSSRRVSGDGATSSYWKAPSQSPFWKRRRSIRSMSSRFGRSTSTRGSSSMTSKRRELCRARRRYSCSPSSQTSSTPCQANFATS